MEAQETDAVSRKKVTSEPTTSMAFATNWGEHWTDSPVADQQLIDTAVFRNPLQDAVSQKNFAANTLASGRRAVRLLWIALIVSLTAHLIIPVCIVTAMIRPEKVALMDGTESLIIAPLVPVEESNEILETLSLWAAKSFLDRGPQGFDAPETLQRVFLPVAAKKAEAEFTAVAEEFLKKNIHQKLEIGRIDLQRLDGGVVMSRVIGQILTQAQIGDEQLSEPQAVTLSLKLVRNPYLGRNKRYPFAVADYAFDRPEQLPIQKRQEK
ncbi:MAG TPA: hypothetical protein VHS80_14995 [Chthoniobacterales bacterium]|nr:hypothetical protein [Chthoniobacterales bacterium]